jgi:hypothetical protein
MKKSFLLGVTWILLLQAGIMAQQLQTPPVQQAMPGFLYDLKGEAISNKYSEIKEGFPFFSDEWLKGKIVSTDGKIYDNLSLKLNLVENEIHYLDDQSAEYILKTPTRLMVLTDFINKKTYTFIQTSTPCHKNEKTWYQVLDTGKVWLLKSEVKQIITLKAYGSAIMEEKVTSSISYYLYTPAECIQLKDPLDLWEKLDARRPGFSEKPATRVSGKKTEEALKQLSRLFNEKAS